jgi:tetratricopeptide (TPR) repeat protein
MLGRQAFDEGRLEVAQLCYRAALGYARQRLKNNPSDPLALRDVAICWDQLGYLLQRIGEVEEADNAYYEAEQQYSNAVKFAERYGEYDRELAIHLLRYATLPMQVLNYAAARDFLERSYEIL